MSATAKLPPAGPMTVAEFLAWCPEDGQRWQLVDGAARAMAPAKRTHGAIQAEIGALLRNHLAERAAIAPWSSRPAWCRACSPRTTCGYRTSR